MYAGIDGRWVWEMYQRSSIFIPLNNMYYLYFCPSDLVNLKIPTENECQEYDLYCIVYHHAGNLNTSTTHCCWWCMSVQAVELSRLWVLELSVRHSLLCKGSMQVNVYCSLEGGAIGGLTTVYSIEKILFTGYRIEKIVSPDHFLAFYSLRTKIGAHFTVYSFLKCSITVYGKKYRPPLSFELIG